MATNTTPYVKVKQQSLECIICMDKYCRPKALACLHSFCEECLEGTPKASPRMVNCPICRKDCILPLDGVKGLPDNFLIISLLDEASESGGCDGPDEGGTEIRLPCTCCVDGEAISQCLDCYKLLCIRCKDIHSLQAETRKHTIATLEDVKAGNVQPRSMMQTKQVECPDHRGNVMEKFCCLCGKRVCSKCIEIGHPAPKHLLILEKDAAQYCQESIGNLMGKAEQIVDKFRKEVDQIKASQKDMNSKAEVVKLQVQNDAQAIVAKVEEEKLSILGDINRLQEKKNSKCTELEHQLEAGENQAREAYKLAKKTMEKSGDKLIEIYPTLLRSLQQLKEEPAEIKPSYIRPPGYTAAASKLTGKLLGKVMDTTLVQLDQLYEVRTVTLPKQGEKKFTFAYGIAVCQDGDLVITDRDEATAYRLTSNGEFKLILNSPQPKKEGNLRRPRDVAVASNAEILIVDHSEYVKVYNSQGRFVRRFTTLQPGENSSNNKPMLRCICITQHAGQEVALIGDLHRRQLTIHKLDGTLIKRLHLTLTPSYMAVSDNNQILIADYNNSRLESINMDGDVQFSIDTIVEGKKMRASGICWGSVRDFYLALHPEYLVYKDYGGVCSIHQFSSEGNHLSCMAKGLNNPVQMVFANDSKLVVTNRVSVNWFRLRCK